MSEQQTQTTEKRDLNVYYEQVRELSKQGYTFIYDHTPLDDIYFTPNQVMAIYMADGDMHMTKFTYDAYHNDLILVAPQISMGQYLKDQSNG